MESGFEFPLLLFLAAAAAAAWFALDYFSAPRLFQKEPPLLPHTVPYVGHILGLLRHGTRYYEMTSAKCKLPIYTLNMLSGKVYIVTSPDLVNAVNRNPKKIAFNPFIAMLGKRITGHDEDTSQIVQHNLNGEHGPGYVIDVHDRIVAALAPGKDLQKTTKAMLSHTSSYLGAFTTDAEINLFEWMRYVVTMCSTRALYGNENPFNKNPKFVDSFWHFDHALNLLIANVLPRILAPKGYRARMELGTAFQQYFENFNPAQSAAMVQGRHSENTRYGITPLNQGRLEVGTLIGVLANTIPSMFYTLVHIYSDAELISDIREELETAGLVGTPEDISQNSGLLAMPETCPLLYSTWQEVLRIHALGAGARYILEDIMLEDTFLLRKGMVVQMPTAVMHNDVAAWGENVKDFQPRRFLKQNSTSRGGFKQNLSAYRPFGGGVSMCPGRHFVTLETMALAACMLSRFDLIPVDGQWNIPRQKQESLATNVFPPEKDIRVKIAIRKGLGTSK